MTTTERGGYYHRNRMKIYCPPCLLDVLADDGEDVSVGGTVDAVLASLSSERLVNGRRSAILAACAPAYKMNTATECDRCGENLQ